MHKNIDKLKLLYFKICMTFIQILLYTDNICWAISWQAGMGKGLSGIMSIYFTLKYTPLIPANKGKIPIHIFWN